MNDTTAAAKYRRFNSYGFLRLYRINPDGTQTQIGSFAGPNAPAMADQRQGEDAAKSSQAIAAVPDLLQACLHAVDGAYDSGNEQDGVEITHEAFTWIKAAIAKATGASQP